MTNDESCYNRKKRFSLNVMVAVNSQEEIVSYSVGDPGRYHDSRVLRRSALLEKIDDLPIDRHVLGKICS